MNPIHSQFKASYFFVLVVLIAPMHAQAHQNKEAITSMLFNSRSGNLEIAHRFYIHDAEQALKHIIDNSADLFKNKASQAAFANYIAKHFLLALDQKEMNTLDILGHEIDGKFFWVYQEIPIRSRPNYIALRYDALMDIWPSQRNIVNIEGLGETRTLELIFSKQRGELKL